MQGIPGDLPGTLKASGIDEVLRDAVLYPLRDGSTSMFEPLSDQPVNDADNSGFEKETQEKEGPGVCGCLLVLAPIGLIIWIVIIWLVVHGIR